MDPLRYYKNWGSKDLRNIQVRVHPLIDEFAFQPSQIMHANKSIVGRDRVLWLCRPTDFAAAAVGLHDWTPGTTPICMGLWDIHKRLWEVGWLANSSFYTKSGYTKYRQVVITHGVSPVQVSHSSTCENTDGHLVANIVAICMSVITVRDAQGHDA